MTKLTNAEVYRVQNWQIEKLTDIIKVIGEKVDRFKHCQMSS